jgi:hypothetical protein
LLLLVAPMDATIANKINRPLPQPWPTRFVLCDVQTTTHCIGKVI